MNEGVLGGRWTWWHWCKLMGQGPHVCSSPIFSHMAKYSFPPMFSIRGASTHTTDSQIARPAWGDSCSPVSCSGGCPRRGQALRVPRGAVGGNTREKGFSPQLRILLVLRVTQRLLQKYSSSFCLLSPLRIPVSLSSNSSAPFSPLPPEPLAFTRMGRAGESLPSPSLFLSLWTR